MPDPPTDLAAVNDKLNLLLDLRRYRDAAKLAFEAVGREPRWAAGHVQLARAFAGLGVLHLARGAALDGVKYAPHDAWAFCVLSYVHCCRGEYPAALRAAGEALRLAPLWVEGYVPRADALNRMGRHAAALRAVRAGLRLAPDDWRLLKERAWALYFLGRSAAAGACAEAARRSHPTQPAFPNVLGLLRMQKGVSGGRLWPFPDFAAADAEFRQALRLQPSEPAYQANLRRNALEAAKFAAKLWTPLAFGAFLVGVAASLTLPREQAQPALIAPGCLALTLWPVGMSQDAMLLTVPRLGLPLPRVALSRRERLAGRAYWAAILALFSAPVVVAVVVAVLA